MPLGNSKELNSTAASVKDAPRKSSWDAMGVLSLTTELNPKCQAL